MRGVGEYVSERWSVLEIDKLYYRLSNPDLPRKKERSLLVDDGKHRSEQRE